MIRLKHSAYKILAVLALVIAPSIAAAENLKISIGNNSLLYLPVYAADISGAFSKNDLDVEMVLSSSGATAMSAMLGGSTDLTINSAAAGLQAIGEGLDVHFLAAAYPRAAMNMVISREAAAKANLPPNATFEDRVKALKGLTIGTTAPNSGAHQLILYLLKKGGLDPDRDVTVSFIGGSANQAAALTQGTIDAAVMSNPFSDMMVRQNGAELLLNGAGGDYEDIEGLLFIAVMATGSWLDEHHETADRFLTALQSGMKELDNATDKSAFRDAVYKKYFSGTDVDDFNSSWEQMQGGASREPSVDPKGLALTLKFVTDFSEQPPKIDEAIIPQHIYVRRAP